MRFLTPDVAILRAVLGMVPDRQTDINPASKAIQSLVAVKPDGQCRQKELKPRHTLLAQFVDISLI